ncbi:MAG: YggS family pyridoxal phosphate-dependent enzyme [Bacteroidales bacterium]|nr:YggS family pyridoxal phosphate-dependent enzyme [Bacteroidales bacterium]
MIEDNIRNIIGMLPPETTLVAVSKFHPVEDIREALRAGQRVFGESRPQELEAKARALAEVGEPAPQWHFIGHLQTNKLKMVLPYVSMVESVDSLHLLQAIEDWGSAAGTVSDVLLEMHIAAEESKQGFAEDEILEIMFGRGKYPHVRICGLMGMATNTDDELTVDADFSRIEDFFLYLKDLFPEMEDFRELSIGMSGDWRTALRHGATIVRIGTAIFGERK